MIQLFFELAWGGMRVREFFLDALPFRHIILYLVPIFEIKCNCAIDGLEAERRVVRADRLGRFATLEFLRDVGQR